jgi:hypothetical protein
MQVLILGCVLVVAVIRVQNEFVECLAALNLLPAAAASASTNQALVRLRRSEWSALRSQLGTPRRASPLFFAEERAKLAQYRAAVRSAQYAQAQAQNQHGAASAPASTSAASAAGGSASNYQPIIANGQLVTGRW